MTRSGSDRRLSWILGFGLIVSYAYFYQAGGWNQNSRFAMVRAIIERHTLQIDAYQLHTQDRAFWEGHYYSDKAPGAALLALADRRAHDGEGPDGLVEVELAVVVAAQAAALLEADLLAGILWRRRRAREEE